MFPRWDEVRLKAVKIHYCSGADPALEFEERDAKKRGGQEILVTRFSKLSVNMRKVYFGSFYVILLIKVHSPPEIQNKIFVQ